ncbi:hypothetical protein GSP35_001686 [Salmonella enterica subsp. salamae]|nr:hypothetical protein [Salmonella enterica subsp. salamae]ECJ2429860.1 hypothetical protein [Salmonella enterica subsp. salamae]EDB1778908.1 hypothetical protein [Salmonella enterica subsp. salamae]EDZ7160162.1 hypothetical protein [Salmonella enterica subsp. salamae]MJK46971.1 hypothetical protein [Salmonella enterica subsp. salamae]
MQPDLLMAGLGRLKFRCNYVMCYTRYVIGPIKAYLEWLHCVSQGRLIVMIQIRWPMQKSWQTN